MKPTLAICRQQKINRKKSLYGIAFIVIFGILTNLQVFWFYGFHTELNKELNCNKIFYRWSILIPAMLLRFLIPMILLTVTNILTIRQVITHPKVHVLYARQYNPWFVYFLPTFWGPFLCFQGCFFRKFCLYVWLVFKSGF